MNSTLMRRYGLPFAALVVLAVLVLTTMVTARSVDSTALKDAVPAGSLPSGALAPVPTDLSCVLARPRAEGVTLSIRGACVGTGPGTAACNAGDESLAASVQMRLTDRRILTLTVTVPDYPATGTHANADVFIQVARRNGAQRWSARGSDVKVDGSGGLSLASTLTPDPGTQTRGRLDVRGHMTCADAR